MDKPLKYDEGIVEEFGITGDIDLDPVIKLAYVRTQLEEITKFLWRERIDLILGETQAVSKNELVADKGRAQVTEHRSNIRQVVNSIRVLINLKDELEATISK